MWATNWSQQKLATSCAEVLRWSEVITFAATDVLVYRRIWVICTLQRTVQTGFVCLILRLVAVNFRRSSSGGTIWSFVSMRKTLAEVVQ